MRRNRTFIFHIRRNVLRIISGLLATLFLVAFATACGSEKSPIIPSETTSETQKADQSTDSLTEQPTKPDAEIISYSLNSTTPGVRILGERYLPSETQINCDWTCSGIEMNVQTSGGDITFTARVSEPFAASCYFRAFIDGEPWLNEKDSPYYTVNSDMTPIVLKDVPAGEHTVRLVKVTGYTLARAEIFRVAFAGTISANAPAANSLYLEFIGDSICCGWGTIGSYQGGYTDQDGTLAYPYLTASALNADYAVTALSGQGLLKGTPGTYTGYLYASALRSTESPYEPLRHADVTIVNIGTNDASLNQPTQFYQALEQLLRAILFKNPNGRVVFIYNTMNDNYSEQILSLCEKAGGAAAGIYSLRFDRAQTEGHPTNHPSVSEQKKEADLLIAFLREKMNEQVTAVPFADSTVRIESEGTGVSIPWNQSAS